MAKTKNEIQREYEKKTDYAAQRKYAQKNTRHIGLIFNLNTDQDILAKLDSVENKTGYIKRLIRDDIMKEKTS
ncbi:MAG: hypothetical protein IJU01_00545 [Lachnospiraceae bacterium]|nr:hypothetical protein [Lachnospiraceae bacterium]